MQTFSRPLEPGWAHIYACKLACHMHWVDCAAWFILMLKVSTSGKPPVRVQVGMSSGHQGSKLAAHSWHCDQGIKEQVPYQWCSLLDLNYLATGHTLMLVCVVAGALQAGV